MAAINPSGRGMLPIGSVGIFITLFDFCIWLIFDR